jgi:UDP-N-acetylglucosamine 2-epimerase (non-hydrolysing)
LNPALCTVVGARPNFMKMAPIILEARRRNISQVFVHTGQHYDAKMSKVFFDELQMPEPDVYLGVGSGSHAEQTGKVMIDIERVLLEKKPKMIVVAGDVNSTLAAALTAAKLNIPVAHVESGLRSFDREMPEEINRILTDHLAQLLFVTEPSGEANLRREGIGDDKIRFVGNTMIDSLVLHREAALQKEPWRALGLEPGRYGIVTLHRPSNVDEPAVAGEIARALAVIARDLPLLFPIHPRTLKNTGALWTTLAGVRVVEPFGYLDFLGLMARASVVVTDSGGIQEETTALGVPCITVRTTTERPVTVEEGTNRLVSPNADDIVAAFRAGPKKTARVPALWDGRAAIRVVDAIAAELAR